MASLRNNFPLKALLVAAGLSAGLPIASLAQEERPPELQDTTSTQFEELVRPGINEKDLGKAIKGIDTILLQVPPESYDEAYLLMMKADFLNQKSNFHEALGALERTLELADRHPNYLTAAQKQVILWEAFQINFLETGTLKDPKEVAIHFAKANRDVEEWLKTAKKITTEDYYSIAALYQAQGQGSSDTSGGLLKPDAAYVEKALHWTELGMRSAAHPRDNFYALKLAELMQLNRFYEASDFLELMVKMKPDNKNYWQQLANTYLQLASTASDKHDEKAAYSYNIRTILAIERAQKLGFMNSPRENYALVGVYFNIGQYAEACRILDEDLKSGTIERTRANYELLANSYTQLHREFKAVEALEEAAKIFPKVGQIEYEIAQTYYSIDKYREAFDHIKRCVAKGGTDKPEVAWLFYAYVALDLKEYDAALMATDKAAMYPEAKAKAEQMKESIKATLQNHETELNSQ
jgi:tetratricopeptide (TPR) repeat protein